MGKMMDAAKWAIGFKGKSPDGPNAEVSNPMHQLRTRQQIQIGVDNPKRGEPIKPTVYPLAPVAKPNPIKKLPVYLKPKNNGKKKPTFIKKEESKRGEWA